MRRAAVILAVALIPFLALGQDEDKKEGPAGPLAEFSSSDKEPIELQADKMEANLGEGRLKFVGHVSARQGERTIYAEEVEIDFTKEGEITFLVASGAVKMRIKDAFANCCRLEFDNVKKVITMLGKPRVVQGRQIIMGDRITYYIETERLVVINPRIEWKPEDKKESGDGK